MKKKYLLLTFLLTFFLSCFSVLASCTAKDKNVKLGDASYYCEINEDAQYTLTIKGNNFTYVGENGSKDGYYKNDGKNPVVFNFKDKKIQQMTGTLDGGVFTLTQGDKEYVFYQNVNRTVTFDIDGGNEIKTETVLNGKKVAEP